MHTIKTSERTLRLDQMFTSVTFLEVLWSPDEDLSLLLGDISWLHELAAGALCLKTSPALHHTGAARPNVSNWKQNLYELT